MRERNWNLSSAGMHILAMAFMLLDHLGATLILGQRWMNCLGRIAFPLFAFMVVEGYFHTHDLKKYLGRMLLFALISEIPFDLLTEGLVFYPFHQNVLWTFLFGLSGIWLMERARKTGILWKRIAAAAAVILGGYLAGVLTMADYYGNGIWMIFLFYFFRGRSWWCFAGQLAGMYWLNVELMGGMYYPVTILGHEVELMQQGFALLALIPIWLYRGRKGYSSTAFRWFCYGFYPAHCLLLGLIVLAG